MAHVMAKSIRAGALCVLLLASVALTGCVSGGGSDERRRVSASYAGRPAIVDGLRVPARATATHVQLASPSGFVDRFWPGLTLGSTTPGHAPGEVSVRAADYRRWFPEMAALGTRVIRVYTLLDPSFYRELRRYNLAHADDPLYVIHGVWIPEGRFLATGDLWDAQVVRDMDDLVEEVHGAVFGDLKRGRRRGLAYGTYDADISNWVIAWSPGVEWDPLATRRSERKNPPRPHRGRFITTVGRSTSTEAWIARALDHLATLDQEVGWSRAMTFTNWLTADPLRHPEEPTAREDLISVDAMHLKATRAWPGGFFASYHAYPYYPDFLRLQPDLRNAKDPYATYLRRLRAHHRGQAIMVTEFGVPSSLGKAHLGPLGRDQGDHSEQRAAKIDAQLLDAIRRTGYAGGILFEWTDEWFKNVWNTTDEEQPAARRALWRNVLTNEEHFGVVATEPGLRKAVELDGKDEEWTRNGSQVLWEGTKSLRDVRAAHDEAYLYLRLRFDGAAQRERVDLGLDVRPGSNRGLPGLRGVMPGADAALQVRGNQVRIWRAAWTDVLAFQYGVRRKYFRIDRRTLKKGSGAWREPQLILNRPYTVPSTGEKRPTELQALSPLRWGAEQTDSRNTVAGDGPVLELRLPWALLGFADPSSRKLTVPRIDGGVGTEQLPESAKIGLGVFDASGRALARPAGRGWEPWQHVTYHERRKAGWDILSDAFRGAAR